MKKLFFVALASMICFETDAAVIFSQPPSSSGAFYQSSWWDPDGSDYDQLTWDNFRVTNAQAITEIGWRMVFSGCSILNPAPTCGNNFQRAESNESAQTEGSAAAFVQQNHTRMKIEAPGQWHGVPSAIGCEKPGTP